MDEGELPTETYSDLLHQVQWYLCVRVCLYMDTWNSNVHIEKYAAERVLCLKASLKSIHCISKLTTMFYYSGLQVGWHRKIQYYGRKVDMGILS